MRALVAGRLADAEHLVADAFELGMRLDVKWAVDNYAVQLMALRRDQGRLMEIGDAFTNAVEQYPRLPVWRCGLAAYHRELGQEVEAREQFERLAAKDFSDLPRDYTWLASVDLLAEVCAFLCDTARAALLYDLLRPYADRTIVIANGVVCLGSAARDLGLLATTIGAWDQAEAHFEAALERNRRMGAQPWLARTQHGYGVMLRRRSQPGDEDRAQRLFEDALDSATRLGLDGVANHVRSERV
jgi:tetratricopeptide (TPR) repeat protein